MVGQVDCGSCKGTGFEPGPDGYWLDGVFYSSRFPCADCNGTGTQDVWYDSCRVCGGSGKAKDGTDCARCKGLGFHEPEPSSKVSRWEVVTD